MPSQVLADTVDVLTICFMSGDIVVAEQRPHCQARHGTEDSAGMLLSPHAALLTLSTYGVLNHDHSKLQSCMQPSLFALGYLTGPGRQTC
jgi:hypothetical protein